MRVVAAIAASGYATEKMQKADGSVEEARFWS